MNICAGDKHKEINADLLAPSPVSSAYVSEDMPKSIDLILIM